MKKLLTMLAVTVVTANLVGCGSCRRCCPWLCRGDACAPAPVYAPVAMAAPCPPQAMPQFVAPMAATAPTCCPTAAPGMGVAPMMSYAEPGCGYVEPSCGQQPYMGSVGYAPTMMMAPNMMGGCTTCDPGFGGMMMSPAPATGVFPVPAE